ncbi:MAG: agmatine deiminase family protein [Candidatus Krumholzibacteriota bacterium]
MVALGAGAFFLRPWTEHPPADIAPETAVETVDSFYMPAEFQPQDLLFLGGAQLAELHPDVLAAIVKAASAEVRIQILAGSGEGRTLIESVLTDNGLPLTSVDILQLPILTMWLRDFGPATVTDANGFRSMVDFHYRERRGNKLDDGVAAHLATGMGLNLMSSRMLVEGGDYLSNGRGLCLLSTRVINRNAHYLEMDPDQTMANFAALLGFETLSMVPPLLGESTGHADMFCAFLRPDLVVVGRYDRAVDLDNAAQLDMIVERLEDFPTLDGPLKVERIPMPDHDDDVWRSYTNIVFANGVLLVPVYPDYCPDLDEVALATYRRLLPDRRVVGIDASRLIRMNGALRCITMNVPSGSPLPPN